MNKLKIGIVQQKRSADKAENMQKSVEAIKKCATLGAELVVLQELHASLYFCQVEDTELFNLAEPIPGPDSEIFAQAAKDAGVVLVSSLFEKRAPGLYHNTAVVFEKDGSIAGTYRKMHIPDDPAFYEKFYFTPGDTGFEPIRTSVGRLGVLVCWDQWYPEAARLMTLAGAEVLIYPTAIGWDPADDNAEKQRQLDAWMIVQRGHAVANGLPVISVNRTGFEADPTGAGRGTDFWGNSFAAGPQGEIIKLFSADKEQIEVVEIDRARTEDVRRIWPFLRDRRIDAYGDLLKRYRD